VSARQRIADPQNILLRAVATECGCHVRDLSASLMRQVQIALVEAYNRGGYDAHERSTVSPPDADAALGAAPSDPASAGTTRPSWETSPTTRPPKKA